MAISDSIIKDVNISVFPNPTVNITSNKAISILSTTGQVIIDVNSDSDSQTLDVSRVAKGIYFIYRGQ
ncbi:MAG: T9SS type A sorting domain-containing protein [Chlamydiia bacterium]|nr:T9SS type A sorting domain-containing protein [Chlamydiia bacterium]